MLPLAEALGPYPLPTGSTQATTEETSMSVDMSHLADATKGHHAMVAHYAPPAHTVPYAKAIAFIEDHGHRVFVTKEGLLALSIEWGNWPEHAQSRDLTCEAPMVFPIDDAGRVDSRAVRDWLGY